MAQRVQYLLVCDLHDDDTPGEETVMFSLDGTSYEVDLCEEHAGEMREVLAPYVGVARRSDGRSAGRRGPRRARRAGGGAARDGRSADIREWARAQGLAVNERGRIPAQIAQAYDAAH